MQRRVLKIFLFAVLSGAISPLMAQPDFSNQDVSKVNVQDLSDEQIQRRLQRKSLFVPAAAG